MDNKKYSINRVVSNCHLKGDYYLLRVAVSEDNETDVTPLPGQFYQVKPVTVGNAKRYGGSLLFKPLSVYDFSEGTLSFMIKVVGSGTCDLASLRDGDKLSMIGPLGKGFYHDSPNDSHKQASVLLISGGIGYAPLYYLHKDLIANGYNALWLHGGRTAEDIFPADLICTDDGSEGDKGLVTKCLPELLSNKQKPISRIYCCGPQAMMKVVRDYTVKYDIPAQFSLEEYMACGIGVCLGCAVKKQNRGDKAEYYMVCTDGPVFNKEEIDWDE